MVMSAQAHSQDDDLIELIYISEPAPIMSDEDIIDILEASQENNEESGITGMLFYDGRYFLQVLEGPKAEVWRIYATILDDPRHKNVVTVHEGPLNHRVFDKWGMAYRRVDPDAQVLRLAREQLASGEGVDPDIIHVGALISRAMKPDVGMTWKALV